MTCTQERFERDVADHQMTIVRDDGVNRHIKFRKADGDSCYWFEILTWPGALCIRGDRGTYVFSRLPDMFQFFRTDRGNDPTKLYINEGYWCEKLQAVSCDGYGNGQAERFSADSFIARVREEFDSYFARRYIGAERLTALWEEIESEVLADVFDGDSGTAFSKLNEFSNEEFPNLFDDCYEWYSSCNEYTFGFIWNLYAIAWAIRTYDAARAATEAA
ncbi:DUF2267 domain-containing protein [Burkholderia vietnamiensis]|uniref:DUF2267 domain-containing protein n=1 Tax=Burkholderia vietnamiensis TaxID=60552 RepID=UPI0015944232|nr:DUF2267 domain-containing protein [Burkholderia vietnamiensis]